MTINKRTTAATAAFFLIFLAGCGFFQPIEQRLVSGNEKTRVKALKKLALMPVDKLEKLTLPLIGYLRVADSLIVNRAVDALAVVGRPAVQDLRKTLKDPDVYARLSAATVLGRIGPQAEAAVPELMICVADPHPLVREEAAFALGQIGPAAAPAENALRKALEDTSPEVRLASFEALKKIGIPPPRNS